MQGLSTTLFLFISGPGSFYIALGHINLVENYYYSIIIIIPLLIPLAYLSEQVWNQVCSVVQSNVLAHAEYTVLVVLVGKVVHGFILCDPLTG